MTFYSHSTTIDEKTTGSKELKTHIDGVKDKAFFHFSDNVNLGYDENELTELLELVIKFHDLGKYTSYFQHYLLKKEPIDFQLKRHAQIGGFTAFNYLHKKDQKKALLSLYLIFLHHSQLIDFGEVSAKLNRNLKDIIQKQSEDIQQNPSDLERDLNIEDLAKSVFYSEERKIRRGFRRWRIKEATIQDYFLINYLFSLLIEGDKLDASNTNPYSLKSINASSVDERFGKPSFNAEDLKKLSDNELRNYCRKVVVSNLDDEEISNQYIFTLTAPTGIGKTMTALDFSLKLKDKIKKESGQESRIIYALPFINIIEQALDEYEQTLGNQDIKILGHYQYADVFGDDKEQKNTDGAEQHYNQKIMALDTWQADIVITSFVQFFETLISNRNKLLKKFNHFANAIIILDEVQTLRLDQMPLLGASLYYLSKFLKTRLILMTATRPKIFELAEQEILQKLDEEVNPKELLTNYEEVFAQFKRTAVHPLLDELPEIGEIAQNFVDLIFNDKWKKAKSCLIVCNTVKQSIEVYDAVQDYLEENELFNPVCYLSTNIVPVHRFERIEAIKNDLKVGKPPIVIATQVVEAGVDLDFDMGFRDIGPIDSIVQVAGRINRNNDPQKRHSPLYIVDFDSKKTIKIYGRLAYQQAKKALEQQTHFKEEEYLKLIETYFDGISGKSSFADSRKFFDSMQNLNYDSEEKKTRPVSAFRIIEESNFYATVFIEVDEMAQEVRHKYLQKILGEIDKEEFNENWKLKFQQHIISVPQYLCDDLETINEYEDDILIVPSEELEIKYDKETGFNRTLVETNSSFTF